jgi:hypothetical protein
MTPMTEAQPLAITYSKENTMSAPQSYWRPEVYPPPHPPAAPWPAHQAQRPNQAPYQPQEPPFQVRLTKHTGLVMAWYNQSYTVTGNFAQCEHAISQAQQYNLIAGWWSMTSVLVWNWVALAANHSARKTLRANAARAFAR